MLALFGEIGGGTLRVQITPWLAYLITLIIIKFGIKVPIHIYFVNPGEQQTFLATFIHILIFAIFVPWVGAVMLVQLRDLELRKQ